jgi:hypothetical protein
MTFFISKPYSDNDDAASTDDDTQLTEEQRGQLRLGPVDENLHDELVLSEHRRQFKTRRKQHYNEFEMVRLRKKEIEEELRALEEEEKRTSATAESKKTTEG